MNSFLKKVLTGNSDADSHRYFVRFGKGDYKRRFLISFNKGERVKVKTSFEFANDLVKFVSEIGGGKTSGIILSKREISDVFSKNRIEGNSEEKRGGLFYKNNLPEQELNEKQLTEVVTNSYFALLIIEGKEFVLKSKPSLPKPGKDEEKIDDGFCSLIIDKKYWPALKDAFFWDVPECKKASIEHELKISEIVLPKGESDPAKIRELATRKGTIVRKIDADGRESSKEIPFEA